MLDRGMVSSWLALETAHSQPGPSHGGLSMTVLTTHHTCIPTSHQYSWSQLDERIGAGGEKVTTARRKNPKKRNALRERRAATSLPVPLPLPIPLLWLSFTMCYVISFTGLFLTCLFPPNRR